MKHTHEIKDLHFLQDAGRASTALTPLRLSLLEQLKRPNSATGLAKRMGLKRQKVNYHLRELEGAGFLEVCEERKCRGCVERLYRVTARAFIVDPQLLGAEKENELTQDRFASALLVKMAAQTLQDVAVLRDKAQARRQPLVTFSASTEISFSNPSAFKEYVEELSAEIARLVAKYNDNGPGSRRFRMVMGVHPARKKGVKPKGDLKTRNHKERKNDGAK